MESIGDERQLLSHCGRLGFFTRRRQCSGSGRWPFSDVLPLSAIKRRSPSRSHGQVRTLDSTGGCNTLETAYAEGVLEMKQRRRIYYTESQKALMWDLRFVHHHPAESKSNSNQSLPAQAKELASDKVDAPFGRMEKCRLLPVVLSDQVVWQDAH